jgi:hypothetical protein
MKHVKVFEDFKKANPVNEAMSLTDYYRNSDKEVKDIAKQIDAIINTADFVVASSKDKLLDLITDLTDAYLADMRDEKYEF